MVAAVTAVTLAGTSLMSDASFCAVTITVGSTMLGGLVWANDAVGNSAANTRTDRLRTMPDIMPASRLPYTHAGPVRCDGRLEGRDRYGGRTALRLRPRGRRRERRTGQAAFPWTRRSWCSRTRE